MTTGIICHECKKELAVQFAGSIVCVCPDCKTLNRTGAVPKDFIIPFSTPTEDLSPIQIGTEGNFHGKKFTVTGRIRYDFSNAYRNQWSVILEDNKRMWLTESYGYYAMIEKSDLKIPASEFRTIKAGHTVEYDTKEWIVETLYKNTAIAGEGELHEWISTPIDHFQVELSHDSGTIILVNIMNQNTFDFFKGEYFEFPQLKFQNYRTNEVWN